MYEGAISTRLKMTTYGFPKHIEAIKPKQPRLGARNGHSQVQKQRSPKLIHSLKQSWKWMAWLPERQFLYTNWWLSAWSGRLETCTQIQPHVLSINWISGLWELRESLSECIFGVVFGTTFLSRCYKLYKSLARSGNRSPPKRHPGLKGTAWYNE